MVDAGAAIGGLSLAGAVALYVIRAELKDKVSVVDARIAAHERECAERNKNADERHQSVIGLLQHMDLKLDRVIEGRHGKA